MRAISSSRRDHPSRIARRVAKLLLLVAVLAVAGQLTRSIDAQGQGRAGAPGGQTPGGGRGAAEPLIDTPIKYTPNPDGYSQTMIPLGDGREILHLVPVGGQLKCVKFRLPETIPPLEFPFGPKR